MRAFYAPATRDHDPRFFLSRGRVARHEDAPGRVDRLLQGVAAADLAVTEAGPAAQEALLRVHTPRYLTFLEEAFEAWQGLGGQGPEVIGNVQPRAPDAQYPDGVVGRAGWHLGDMACPIGAHTVKAAFAAAGC
ncbi:MAG: histone deacetylase family protein, partial [Pseudomonadota bacterium]